MEKLKAANIRKEKVDRALNKELGKTHSVLCQARGLLEQANQSAKNQPWFFFTQFLPYYRFHYLLTEILAFLMKTITQKYPTWSYVL